MMSGLPSVRQRSRLKCGNAWSEAKNLGRTDRFAANCLKFQSLPAYLTTSVLCPERNFSLAMFNNRFSPRLEHHQGKRGRKNICAGGDQKHGSPLPRGLLKVICE